MSKSTDPRQKYVTIATRQFAEHGFHGVSLAALAKEAGVSKQALLHFFGTKERLYGDVLIALGDRLCAQIEAAYVPDPSTHLAAYFSDVAEAAISDAEDVRLVVRALLDSDPKAQRWPLKPYLDRLIDLVRATPNGSGMSRDLALAEAYQFIGALQYVAISLPTLQGIYGDETRNALAGTVSGLVQRSIARLCLGT